VATAGTASGIAGGGSQDLPSSECLKLEGLPFFDPDRGDCGTSPPADMSLRNGPVVSTAGGAGGAGNTGATGGGPAILWCSSPTDIWGTDVVSSGYAGSSPTKLQHWDGSEWTTVTAPYDYYFEAAWGHAADDVWFVGHAGHVSWNHGLFVLHWNGTRLEVLKLPAAPNGSLPLIMGWQEVVTGRADGNVWVGADGAVYRIPAPLPPDCLTPFEAP
jgi:hypothetical protein